MWTPAVLTGILSFAVCSFAQDISAPHTWRFISDGKIQSASGSSWSFRKNGRIEANFVRLDNDTNLVLKMMEGENASVPIAFICDEDRSYLEKVKGQAVNEEQLNQEAVRRLELRGANAKALETERVKNAQQILAKLQEAKNKQSADEQAKNQFVADQLALVRKWRPWLVDVASGPHITGYDASGTWYDYYVPGPYSLEAREILRLDSEITSWLMRADVVTEAERLHAEGAAAEVSTHIQRFLQAGVLK